MVEDQSKPIRRKAYLEQKKRDAIREGEALAKNESQKNMQKNLPQKRTKSDFGIGEGLADPMKFINQSMDKHNSRNKKSKNKKEKKK